MSIFRLFRPATFRPAEGGVAKFRPQPADVVISVSEGLGLAEAATGVDCMSVLEAMELAESIVVNLDYNISVAETLSFSEALILTVLNSNGGPSNPNLGEDCSTPYWPEQDFEVD